MTTTDQPTPTPCPNGCGFRPQDIAAVAALIEQSRAEGERAATQRIALALQARIPTRATTIPDARVQAAWRAAALVSLESPDDPTDRADAADVRARQIQAARDVLLGNVEHNFDEVAGLLAIAAELVDAVNAAGDPTACPACPTDPHDEPTEPHAHATPYGYAIYAPNRLALVDELMAAGYREAITRCRDGAAYDAWVRTQPHSWTRADYLEAVGPQRDAQRPETVPDGSDGAGVDAGSGEAETGGSHG